MACCLNLEEYQDKVLGCWTGKSVGGTLGAPFEGSREMNDIVFYTQEFPDGAPPNDDLDLQLVWLQAVEEHGVFAVTPRLLGEYWMRFVTGPWNEYAVCKANIRRGFHPPLSGACNNERWKWSNGAWIRSEIWACLFPGNPDMAAFYASLDASADHCGEGVYAEMFTASLESAAFVEPDIRRLIEIALSKIPGGSRIERAVRIACEGYDAGRSLRSVREAVVKDSEDLGFFQAPANLGFVTAGLLYGEGDFGKTLCSAVNCGDDTDCTGATCGSIMGILLGRRAMPEKWTAPLGERIQTVAVNPFPGNLNLPRTLGDLTRRTVNAALEARRRDPRLLAISAGQPSTLDSGFSASLSGGEFLESRVWKRPVYYQEYPVFGGSLLVEYRDSPLCSPGEGCRLIIRSAGMPYDSSVMTLRWDPPSSWTVFPGKEFSIRTFQGAAECTLVPGSFDSAFAYLPLHVTISGRMEPVTLNIPFQLKDAVFHDIAPAFHEYHDALLRLRARQAFQGEFSS